MKFVRSSKTLSRLALISAITLLSACGGGSLTKDAPALSSATQARFAEVSATEMISEAERRLKEAHTTELPYFAPKTMLRAEEALKEMIEESRTESPERDEMIKLSLLIEKAVEDAASSKESAQRQLGESFKMKAALDEVSAAQHKKRTYDSLMKKLKELVEYIEEGELEKAQSGQEKLVLEMKAFEVEAIKANTLNPARLALEEAEDKDADDLAPKSFEKAKVTLARTAEYVEKHPHDKTNVTRLGKESLLEARHAKYVALAVERLQEIDRDDMELIVIDEESRLQKIGNALDHQDIRDRPLHEQAATLAKAIGDLARGKRRQDERLSALESKLSDNNDISGKQLAEINKLNETIASLEQQKRESEEKSALIEKEKQQLLERIVELDLALKKSEMELAKNQTKLKLEKAATARAEQATTAALQEAEAARQMALNAKAEAQKALEQAAEAPAQTEPDQSREQSRKAETEAIE